MSLPAGNPPRLWIIAGPNGSGKSTVVDQVDIEDFDRSAWIINPDHLSARLSQVEGLNDLDANREALDRIDAWLYASIQAHQTIGVETVLSTGKYRQRVTTAKRRGFEVRLIYVLLEIVELNIERVKARVAKGGHDVPEAAIRDRYARSLAQLPWFVQQADHVTIYDNSGAEPERVSRAEGDKLFIDRNAPIDLQRALGLA